MSWFTDTFIPSNPFVPPDPIFNPPPAAPPSPLPDLVSPPIAPPSPLPGVDGPIFPAVPFIPGLTDPGSTEKPPKPEDRINEFKYADGRPMWTTDAQKDAILKILQQNPYLKVEDFQRSQCMALMSEETYTGSGQDPKGFTSVKDEELLALGLDPAKFTDPSTGLRADLYKNDITGEYTLAFAGTDGKGEGFITDLKNGVSELFDPRAKQFGQAVDLARAVQEKLGDKLTDLTGHSLGGGLAAAASALTGIRATTFNALGVSPATIEYLGGTWDPAKQNANITNYRVAGDPLTEAQEGHTASDLAHLVEQQHEDIFGFYPPLPLHPNLPWLHEPQFSYISGVHAEQLPDAIGTQITLQPRDKDGNAMGEKDVLNPGNWIYLHDFTSVNLGMGLDEVVRDQRNQRTTTVA